jgi:hypothetical protein
MFELLRLNEFYGESEAIEIAKGKNELPLTLKKGFKQLRRELKWLRRN